jgi:6-pyruvoyltetrahydropterin/6-carboxytetrahydropterin synthase
MTLTRRYRFSSTHRLHSLALSDAENVAVYGKCNHPYGHGHDYVLDVSVTGPLDDETGRIVDLETLDTLVGREVLARLEHKNLNTDVEGFTRAVPTTENLAVAIDRWLKAGWTPAFGGAPAKLVKIRIEETKRNHIELA